MRSLIQVMVVDPTANGGVVHSETAIEVDDVAGRERAKMLVLAKLVETKVIQSGEVNSYDWAAYRTGPASWIRGGKDEGDDDE